MKKSDKVKNIKRQKDETDIKMKKWKWRNR